MVRDAIIRAAHERLFEVRQLAMLLLVCEQADLSVRELAEQLAVGKPAVSRGIAALVERGLVSSRPNKDDKRLVVVQATPQGRATMRRIVGGAA